MKKFLFLAAFAFGAMTFTSCSKDCCKFLTVKQCEGDEPDGMTWDEYKAELESTAYNCD